MSEGENQCEMFVPASLLLDVIEATVFCSESKTPSADSTIYSTATATNRMTKATTEATKLNFMTDQGSSRDSVSIAWRRAGLRTCGRDEPSPFCPRLKTEATELAKPDAAPVTAEAAPVENPLTDEKAPPEDDPLAPVVSSAPGAAVVAVAGPVPFGRW